MAGNNQQGTPRNSNVGEVEDARPIPKTTTSLIINVVVIAMGALLGTFVGDAKILPFFAIAYGINWISGAYGIAKGTEHFYDLTGAIAYNSMGIGSVIYAAYDKETKSFSLNNLSNRQALLTWMLMFWSLRLGLFLFMRISKDGEDKRFRRAKQSPMLFFVYWNLQALWNCLCALPTMLVNASQFQSSNQSSNFQAQEIIGFVIWTVGILIEAAADHQKTQFKLEPRNKGKFITVGLWKYSRHPNYFGEIMLWIGSYFVATTGMTTAGYLWCLISPIFVINLLWFVSGVPLLEQMADKRWGNNPEYQRYKNATSVLILWPPKRSS